MSASLSDLFTTAKSLVTAIGTLTTQYLNIEGAQNSKSLSATTLVKNSAGRVARISVTTAGSAAGHIYDTISITDTANPIYVIPNTLGIYIVNFPANYGIVAAPGTGQVLTVSYS